MLGYLMVLLLATAATGEHRRVCYYTSWSMYRPRQYSVLPTQLDPFVCTHLNFAFADLDVNETEIVPFDNRNDLRLYSEMNSLKLQNPELKTLISVGGWNMGSEPFIATLSSDETMRKFVTSTISFLRKYNFDGVDLDWEYPAARGSKHADKAKFVTLCQMLREEFDNEANIDGKSPLLLTAAVGVSEYRVRQSYDVQALSRYLDFINLMMYDFHGQWEDTVNVHSALYSDNDFNIDRFIKYWIQMGAQKDKLVVGVPFYGHTFILSDTNNTDIGANYTEGTGGTITYVEICEKINQGGIQPIYLTRERVPYYIEDNMWVGYDNVQSISEKGAYIREHGLGGAMIWAVDFDDVYGLCSDTKYPLMKALKASMAGEGSIVG